MVSYCCVTNLTKLGGLKQPFTIFMFHGWSADLSWAWYTSCICPFGIGWTVLMLWGCLAVCWSRMALPGTSGLSSMWSFILQQAEFPKRGQMCATAFWLIHGKGILSLPPCFSGQSQSQGQPSVKSGEVECTPFHVGPRGCMAAL